MAGEQILIVEDNEKNMKLLRDVLQVKGYRTLEATSGELALTPATGRHKGLRNRCGKMTALSLEERSIV